jgi:hypothetical protein
MNLDSESKTLIDGYIDEVSVNLPKKMRPEIGVEIYSAIMDALEDRSPDDDPDESAVLEVLKELGSPISVANSYHPHNYVIGPKLYAPFWMTIRGSLLFMGFFYLLGFILSWSGASNSIEAIGNILWELVSGFWKNALQTFAVIFLVFILLDRTIPESDWVGQLKAWGAISNIPFLRGIFGRSNAGEWDPSIWKSTPKSEWIKKGETIFEIMFIILITVLFNLFPHKVGAYGIYNGEPWFVPLLAPTFKTFLPWWNLYWFLTLGLNFSMLIIGRWTRGTRWAEVGLMALSWIIIYWMLTGPAVLGLSPAYLATTTTSNAEIQLVEETILPILTTVFKASLVLHLIVKGITGIYKAFQLLGRPPVLVCNLKTGEK